MGHPNLPQALMLLSEMNSCTQHVTNLVDNMLQKVHKGELTTDQGLSFLEMKYHTLLSYLINLTFIVLKKCTGENIEGDPCIDRLIELRTVLEKIRPIDRKLKYQIDKLVKTASSDKDINDAINYRANPDSLINNDNSSGTSDEESGEDAIKSTKSNIYVPPKLAAVHYIDDTAFERNKKIQERSKKHALSSSVIEELKEEYLDTPVEIVQNNPVQKLFTKQEKERQQYEEDYLTRLPVSKVERQMRKKLTSMGDIGHELTNFGSVKSGKKRKLSAKIKGRKSFKRKRH